MMVESSSHSSSKSGNSCLRALYSPTRRAELFLVGVQLLARHQLHELIVAGTFDLERSLDV